MCIDEQLISSYLDGELCEPYKSQTEEHLSYCKACNARLEKLKKVSDLVKLSSPSDEVLSKGKDEVFALLEKKYLGQKKKHISFLRRKFEVTFPTMVTSAAAVVVIFVGGFVLFGSNSSQTNEIVPSFNLQAGQDNVRFVSNKEQGLDSYSLEEIMKYLDSKGYEVDISIKGLKPLEETSTEPTSLE
ncbi:MAG: zf-HC2 domain-containing protein [Sphaerochaetaceae bacterium]|nr:zf-HC2 domain-containing protein [Sphaerochaetaceae bacterium]